VERGRDPLKGYWSLPGGLVETGELLREAIVREVFEETGLRVKPSARFEIFERIMRDARGRAEYHYGLCDCECKVVGGELRPGDDVSRAEWVPLSRLNEFQLTPGTEEVIRTAHASRKRS
jgi:8-oxo-dGTP diphosphatase